MHTLSRTAMAAVVLLPGLALTVAAEDTLTPEPAPAGFMLSFSSPESVEPWRPVDDRVMGGVSRSRMGHTGEYAVFEGDLSLENNGGFCSVRAVLEPPRDLRDARGLLLRVRGDGKRYRLTLRPEDPPYGVTYHAWFETAPATGQAEGEAREWQEIPLPFASFRPRWRGRSVPQAGPLDPRSVEEIGLLVADGQEGRFRLEVDGIRALEMPDR